MEIQPCLLKPKVLISPRMRPTGEMYHWYLIEDKDYSDITSNEYYLKSAGYFPTRAECTQHIRKIFGEQITIKNLMEEMYDAKEALYRDDGYGIRYVEPWHERSNK